MDFTDVILAINRALAESDVRDAMISFPKDNTIVIDICNRDLRTFHKSFSESVSEKLWNILKGSFLVVEKVNDDGTFDVSHVLSLI